MARKASDLQLASSLRVLINDATTISKRVYGNRLTCIYKNSKLAYKAKIIVLRAKAQKISNAGSPGL